MDRGHDRWMTRRSQVNADTIGTRQADACRGHAVIFDFARSYPLGGTPYPVASRS